MTNSSKAFWAAAFGAIAGTIAARFLHVGIVKVEHSPNPNTAPADNDDKEDAELREFQDFEIPPESEPFDPEDFCTLPCDADDHHEGRIELSQAFIETMKTNAYNQGYNQGYWTGHREGHTSGYDEGFSDGQVSGYDAASAPIREPEEDPANAHEREKEKQDTAAAAIGAKKSPSGLRYARKVINKAGFGNGKMTDVHLYAMAAVCDALGYPRRRTKDANILSGVKNVLTQFGTDEPAFADFITASDNPAAIEELNKFFKFSEEQRSGALLMLAERISAYLDAHEAKKP